MSLVVDLSFTPLPLTEEPIKVKDGSPVRRREKKLVFEVEAGVRGGYFF